MWKEMFGLGRCMDVGVARRAAVRGEGWARASRMTDGTAGNSVGLGRQSRAGDNCERALATYDDEQNRTSVPRLYRVCIAVTAQSVVPVAESGRERVPARSPRPTRAIMSRPQAVRASAPPSAHIWHPGGRAGAGWRRMLSARIWRYGDRARRVSGTSTHCGLQQAIVERKERTRVRRLCRPRRPAAFASRGSWGGKRGAYPAGAIRARRARFSDGSHSPLREVASPPRAAARTAGAPPRREVWPPVAADATRPPPSSSVQQVQEVCAGGAQRRASWAIAAGRRWKGAHGWWAGRWAGLGGRAVGSESWASTAPSLDRSR